MAMELQEAEGQAVQFEGEYVKTEGKGLKPLSLPFFFHQQIPFCHNGTVLWRLIRLGKKYLLERFPRVCSLEGVHVFCSVLVRTYFIKELIRQYSGNNVVLLEGNITMYEAYI